MCHPGTDNDPTYAMAQAGVRDASYPHEYIPFEDTLKPAFIKEESGIGLLCVALNHDAVVTMPLASLPPLVLPCPGSCTHQPLTRHWSRGDPGPGAREEREGHYLFVVTRYTV